MLCLSFQLFYYHLDIAQWCSHYLLYTILFWPISYLLI